MTHSHLSHRQLPPLTWTLSVPLLSRAYLCPLRLLLHTPKHLPWFPHALLPKAERPGGEEQASNSASDITYKPPWPGSWFPTCITGIKGPSSSRCFGMTGDNKQNGLQDGLRVCRCQLLRLLSASPEMSCPPIFQSMRGKFFSCSFFKAVTI